MKQKELNRLVQQVNSWENTFPPACACGCGDPVRISMTRGPNKYINGQHMSWDQQSMKSEQFKAIHVKTREAHGIPIEQFRAALRKIKAQKGMTWAQMAEAGGQSRGWIMSYMFDHKRLVSINKDTATLFLQKLAGVGTPPSKHQERTAPKQIARTNMAIAKIGMDPKKIKPDTSVDWVDAYRRDKKTRQSKRMPQ